MPWSRPSERDVIFRLLDFSCSSEVHYFILDFKFASVFTNLKCLEVQKVSLRGRFLLLVIYHNQQVNDASPCLVEHFAFPGLQCPHLTGVIVFVLESPKCSCCGAKGEKSLKRPMSRITTELLRLWGKVGLPAPSSSAVVLLRALWFFFLRCHLLTVSTESKDGLGWKGP